MASNTARKAVLGDWNRVVRDPLDVLRLVFLAGIVLFAVLGDVKGIGNLVVATVAVLLARAAALPRVYDLAVIVAMAFTGWGEALGLYDSISWYDNVVHFTVPLLTSQVLYLCLARLEVLPDLRQETLPRHHLGIFVVTFALGVAVGGLWEIVEYASDNLLGSELQLGNDDTVGDLIADTLGSLCGALLLVAWTRFGWGSVKRVPGTNEGEEVSA
jgi:hypothetical protein